MANPEESNPLLKHHDGRDERALAPHADVKKDVAAPVVAPTESLPAPPPVSAEWMADGLPLGQGSVVGEPVGRALWNSSLFACLGRNDEFCSSDLEVCLLGTFAPCVLYGGNAERLQAVPGTFSNHCLLYTALCVLGYSFFGSNSLAPWISHRTRTAIRRRFNLEGSFEAFTRSCGCCRGVLEDDVKREHVEEMCDFLTHYSCHPCSLCQEGRELRRRLLHPGFNGRPVLVMMPPVEQIMGRGA